MTEFDKLYHLVQEMNKNWDDLKESIRSGQYFSMRAEESRRVALIDDISGEEYGFIVVDGNGSLRSIDLEPYEISQSNERQVLSVIIAALNSESSAPQAMRMIKGVNVYG